MDYHETMKPKKILVTGGSGFIGSHLVSFLNRENYTVLNIDIKKPINNENIQLWENVSILDMPRFRKTVMKFNPDFIVHLSATTTQNTKSLNEVEVNIQGTMNLIEIVNDLTGLKKLIFTSTQYVNSPGLKISESTEKLHPYGFYGESKLLGEEIIRNSSLKPSWTIIRPTTIWGPLHPILANGLWKQIWLGRYFHPKRDNAVKAYGYVRNSVWQIVRLLEIENHFTDKKIFYIADENMSQDRWVSAFASRLTNQKMRRMPKFILFILSEIGELFGRFGIGFPLFRSRYRNLITSNPSPIENTLVLLGPSPIPFEEAVDETCSWLRQFYNPKRDGY